MAKNETDSGLFVALNYFSHLTLCLSEKMRRCFKSSDISEKTSDFFHALAVTDSTTLESGVSSLSPDLAMCLYLLYHLIKALCLYLVCDLT